MWSGVELVLRSLSASSCSRFVFKILHSININIQYRERYWRIRKFIVFILSVFLLVARLTKRLTAAQSMRLSRRDRLLGIRSQATIP
jgi:hypothetical protein